MNFSTSYTCCRWYSRTVSRVLPTLFLRVIILAATQSNLVSTSSQYWLCVHPRSDGLHLSSYP